MQGLCASKCMLGRLSLPTLRTQDASDYVVQLAGDMPLFAPEHVLNGAFLHDDWRPELARALAVHRTTVGPAHEAVSAFWRYSWAVT